MEAVINLWPIKNKKQNKTRLLRKASKTFLISSSIILLLSATALIFYTRYLLKHEIEEELYSSKDRLERSLIKNPDHPGIPPIMSVKKVSYSERETLKDTMIYDPLQDEEELFRQLSGTKVINGQSYRIAVRVMVIEFEDILSAILISFLLVILLGFIFLFYLNKSRNEKLWEPFFANLERLKAFSLTSDRKIQFVESNIVEFNELNLEIEQLTTKVRADYNNLKQFTEDVSHEIQTPLAIMQAKIETFINNNKIDESHFEEIASLQEDIQRLKQLNKRLILLAKIENNQFVSTEVVAMNAIVDNSISNFCEILDKEFTVIKEANVDVVMDKYLAQVLVNNLISNAIKYSETGEPITVTFKKDELLIANFGAERIRNPEKLFERFYKEAKQSDSIGLGLAIVKKICDHYGFVPSYHFREKEAHTYKMGQHIFKISFNSKI